MTKQKKERPAARPLYQKKCRECGKFYDATHPQQWYCTPCKKLVSDRRHARNAEAIFRD